MTYYFSDTNVANAALKHKSGVKADFQQLCDGNAEFKRSLETTTKSLEATVTRFATWATALQNRLKRPLQIPKLENKAIRF
jgi:hypothetical protein